MPTFPRSSLSFRTAGFPQYGWKTGISGYPLPHSEGIAYKPPCGEIAMGLRVGRMSRLSADGPGQDNPDLSEGLCYRGDHAVHEGRRQTVVSQRMLGAGLS